MNVFRGDWTCRLEHCRRVVSALPRAKSAASSRKTLGATKVADDDAEDAVVPVYITKESELTSEMSEIAKQLDLKNDWDTRNRAMKRLTVRLSAKPTSVAVLANTYRLYHPDN